MTEVRGVGDGDAEKLECRIPIDDFTRFGIVYHASGIDLPDRFIVDPRAILAGRVGRARQLRFDAPPPLRTDSDQP